jgi:hypothetical protein
MSKNTASAACTLKNIFTVVSDDRKFSLYYNVLLAPALSLVLSSFKIVHETINCGIIYDCLCDCNIFVIQA